jgi:S-formylglutathione hydrolase FrmB
VPLTSTAFFVVCVLGAVALPVATLVLWSRTRGPAGLQWAQRLGLIVLCQVAALALVGTAVNNYFFFYSSWSDLLGTSHPGTISSLGAAPGAVPATFTAERRAIVRARKAGNQLPGGGVVLNQTFVGPQTGLRTPALVYLPPQYFEAQYAHTKFPVALLFPGYPGNPPIYFTQLPVDRIMQTEVAAGRANPFVVVVVKETPLAPRDTECANVPNGPQVETFLSQEVRDQVKKVLRVRTDRQGWAMMGSSTGGFCAVKMVMQHPDEYGSAVGLSGYYHALLDNTTGALYGGSQSLRHQNDILWRLAHLPAPAVSVLATISEQERTYPQTVALMKAAKPPLQLSTIVSPTGGHNPHTYGAVMPQAVDWLSKQFGPLRTAGSSLGALGSGSTTTASGAALR